MIGRTIFYKHKETDQVICTGKDVTGSLEEAMEVYRYGYKLRRGDPQFDHLPSPELVYASESH